MAISSGDDDQAEVSMSPLIDCVFLLLIFFLVSTMSKKENKDIEISLPVSSSAEKLLPSNKIIVIGVDIKNNLFFEGVPVTLNALHLKLREIGVVDPNQRIRLDADEKTSMRRVVEVLDLCQFNHLSNVGIRTYDEHYNKR
ncbi:MAG: biopolymer transporter ExbD [Lentisphaeria bacterium]|nr:biopolymer transporter ExbD [Lentisphaeria bacterium]